MNVAPSHDPLLNIRGLSVEFPVRGGVVTAVSDVNLSIESGEIFGLIGESGSGKFAERGRR